MKTTFRGLMPSRFGVAGRSAAMADDGTENIASRKTQADSREVKAISQKAPMGPDVNGEGS